LFSWELNQYGFISIARRGEFGDKSVSPYYDSNQGLFQEKPMNDLVFALTDPDDDSLNKTVTKKCGLCKIIKDQTEYRRYGKGFRNFCKECEDKQNASVEDAVEYSPLIVKSSMGFSAKIEGDTYVISQNKSSVRLQPHEAVSLIDWLKTNLYPEETIDE